MAEYNHLHVMCEEDYSLHEVYKSNLPSSPPSSYFFSFPEPDFIFPCPHTTSASLGLNPVTRAHKPFQMVD